jgi:hypothetical protein
LADAVLFTTYSGTLFRVIPNGASDPLATNFALTGGGRWNPPNSFEVFYTFTNQSLAREYAESQLAAGVLTLEEAEPEALPDLLVLRGEYPRLVDAASDEGLQALNLPITYPIGFTGTWAATQPIGLALFTAGNAGLVTRSASASSWAGPVSNWGEVCIFVGKAPLPTLVDRLSFREWLVGS